MRSPHGISVGPSVTSFPAASAITAVTIVFFIVWTVTLGVFYAFDLPIGPGNGIHLD